jgi:hypothetical protein
VTRLYVDHAFGLHATAAFAAGLCLASPHLTVRLVAAVAFLVNMACAARAA